MDSHPPPPPTRRALVLSGGGARGAFQIGVWQYLCEQGWSPDVICGSSVGAINATAIACGLSLDQIIQLWRGITRSSVYRYVWMRALYKTIFKRRYAPLRDTAPLRRLLRDHLDLNALRSSAIKVYLSAVDMQTGRPTYFDNQQTTIQHVMASSAIPLFFPWHWIDQKPYWDGGVMVNVPLSPAFEEGVQEIVVVLLSPVGKFDQPRPSTFANGLELMFVHLMLGSYQVMTDKYIGAALSLKQVALHVVAPERMLGFKSLVNFSPRQSMQLMDHGYNCARAQLESVLTKAPKAGI